MWLVKKSVRAMVYTRIWFETVYEVWKKRCDKVHEGNRSAIDQAARISNLELLPLALTTSLNTSYLAHICDQNYDLHSDFLCFVLM